MTGDLLCPFLFITSTWVRKVLECFEQDVKKTERSLQSSQFFLEETVERRIFCELSAGNDPWQYFTKYKVESWRSLVEMWLRTRTCTWLLHWPNDKHERVDRHVGFLTKWFRETFRETFREMHFVVSRNRRGRFACFAVSRNRLFRRNRFRETPKQ